MSAPEKDPPKRGRPKADEPRSTVSTWLKATEHDRLIELANRRGQSVSATVRELLLRKA